MSADEAKDYGIIDNIVANRSEVEAHGRRPWPGKDHKYNGFRLAARAGTAPKLQLLSSGPGVN
jgi:hypothetical protein